MAEDLLRSGSATSLQWEDVTLTTQFQPILAARRGERVGHEAVLRAQDASGTPIKPAKLLEDAASRGRLVQLDRAVRALHLRSFAAVDEGDGKLFLGVHPDALITDIECAGEFADLVRYYGMRPKRVCIEMLSYPCRVEEALGDAVAAYREIGVTVALDDFGVGCSNLDRLSELRPPLVRLRQATLTQAIGEFKAKSTFPALVAMLQDAGCRVMVGGIDTVQQALAAIDAHADFLQGGYFTGAGSGVGSEDFVAKVFRRLAVIRAQRLAAPARG